MVCDITIIEVKNEDGINNYLEIDNDIINNISNVNFKKESIYTIQYERQKEEPSVSFGIIDEINNYTFELLCNTEEGSSSSPILNINNNKLIGIHNIILKIKIVEHFYIILYKNILNLIITISILKNLIKKPILS